MVRGRKEETSVSERRHCQPDRPPRRLIHQQRDAATSRCALSLAERRRRVPPFGRQVRGAMGTIMSVEGASGAASHVEFGFYGKVA